MYISFTILAFLQTAIALTGTPVRRDPSGTLFLADKGVGHRSSPIPRWRTSIRRLDTDGTDVATVHEFGPAGSPGSPPEPVGASSLTYDPLDRKLYLASGQSIIRTELDGSNETIILQENNTSSGIGGLTISNQKLYFGTTYEGLIKRANLDGSNIEVFLNVSQGINYKLGSYTASYSYATGIAIDQENDFIYWSAYTSPADLSSHLPRGGSIRRAPLRPNPGPDSSLSNSTDVEILVEEIYTPRQMRLISSTLYWTEHGQYYTEPTALKRAQFPATKVTAPGAVPTDTLAHSNTTDLFIEDGNIQKLTSFTVDEETEKLWLCSMSDGRIMYGRIFEMGLDGEDLKLLNKNTTQIGVPVGLEYVS